MTRPRETRRTQKTAAQRLGSAVTCLFAAVGALTQVNLVHAEEPNQQQFRLDQPIFVAEAVESTPKRLFSEDDQPHFRIDKPIYVAQPGDEQTRPLFPAEYQPSLRRNQQRLPVQPVKNVLRSTDSNPSANLPPVVRADGVGQEFSWASSKVATRTSPQDAQRDSRINLPQGSNVATNFDSQEQRHPHFRIDQPIYAAQVSTPSSPPASFSQEPLRNNVQHQVVEPVRGRSGFESLDLKLVESSFHQTSPATLLESPQERAKNAQLPPESLASGLPMPAINPAVPEPIRDNISRVDRSVPRTNPAAVAGQDQLHPQHQAELPSVAEAKAERSSTQDWTEQLRHLYGDDTPIYVGYVVNNETFRDSIVTRTSLQEADPMIPAVPQVPEVPQLPQGSAASTPESESETYGEEPQDFNIQFLRTASVLLKQGQWQYDYGIQYAKDDFDAPVNLSPSGVVRGDLKRRTVQVPFALRYGLTDRMQLSAALPVGWSNAQFSSNGLFDQSDSQTGIGDLELGMNYHLRYGQFQCTPDVILSFGLTVPTGDGQFPTAGISQASLANDVWAPSVQMLFIHRNDPIVYYYGLGYRYQFEGEFDGVDVQYGQQINYNLGVGFAVNDRVTLSTTFLGTFQSETEVNGLGVPGSIFEPLSLRFAVTSYRCGTIIEPYAVIGMTNDAADAIIGITWTH